MSPGAEQLPQRPPVQQGGRAALEALAAFVEEPQPGSQAKCEMWILVHPRLMAS